MKRPVREPDGPQSARCDGSVLDRFEGAADDAELVADLAAQENQGNDRDDRDECKDECVFGQTLALVRASDAFHDGGESPEQRHPLHLLSAGLTSMMAVSPADCRS